MKWNNKTFERYKEEVNLFASPSKHKFFFQMNLFLRTTQHRLRSAEFIYHKLREGSESLVPKEAMIFKGHNFGNAL